MVLIRNFGPEKFLQSLCLLEFLENESVWGNQKFQTQTSGLEKFSCMQSTLSLNRIFSQFPRVFYLFLVLKSPFLVNLRHQYWFYYNKGVKCVCPFLTPLGIMGQPPVSIILIFIISLYFRYFSSDFDLRQFSKFSIFFGDIFWNFFLLWIFSLLLRLWKMSRTRLKTRMDLKWPGGRPFHLF